MSHSKFQSEIESIYRALIRESEILKGMKSARMVDFMNVKRLKESISFHEKQLQRFLSMDQKK